jgi:hypothetical protein
MSKEWIVLVDDENGDERIMLQPTEDKKLARALAATINDLFPYVNAKAIRW